MAQKPYGLIKPQKAVSRLAAFNNDSDSDDDPSSKKKVFTGMGEAQKRQARLAQENALKEDPTIYQYDELYDDINTTREEAKKAKGTQAKNSKYMEGLMLGAKKRKIEYERQIERKHAKERQEEGDKFKDKEVFVTATYRAKMEELKLAEEAEKREEYLESIGDVTKQRDLDGFYRHLYEQKLGSDKAAVATTSEDAPKAEEPSAVDDKPKEKKQRTYRKRLSNENEEEEAAAEVSKDDSKTHLQSNLDADSDFSIDSDSDEEEGAESASSKDPKPAKEDSAKVVEGGVVVKTEPADTVSKEPAHEFAKPEAVDKKEEKEEKEVNTDVLPEVKPAKVKIDIWKKRTVGDVFDTALQRYYERKEMRG